MQWREGIGSVACCVQKRKKEDNKNYAKSLKSERGYASDTDDYTQIDLLLDTGASSERESRAGILATPRLIHTQLLRKSNESEKKSLEGYHKHGTGDTESRAKQKIGFEDKGLQYMQNEPASGPFGVSIKRSCTYSEIESSQENLVRNKEEVRKLTETNELRFKRSANSLLGENDKRFNEESSGISAPRLKSFAATYVENICKEALSRTAKEWSKKYAKEYVANIIYLARWGLIQQERTNIQPQEYLSEDQENELTDGSGKLCLSNLCKYPSALSREQTKSQENKRKREEITENDFNIRREVWEKDERDVQFEEFLERTVVNSLEESDDLNNSSFLNLEFEREDEFYFLPVRNNLRCLGLNSELEKASKSLNQFSKTTNCVSQYQVSTKHFESTMNEIAVIRKGEMKTEESMGNENDSTINGLNLEDVLRQVAGTDLKVNEKVTTLSDLPTESCDSSLSSCKKRFEKSTSQDNPNNILDQCFRHRRFYQRTGSESPGSERKQWRRLETCNDSVSFLSTTLQKMAVTTYVRSVSCPVVSQDDVMFESMVSHHRDVYDSLSRRIWIILRVYELWTEGKPMDAIQSCIDLTGMDDVEQHVSSVQSSRDYALFLNILQQLPSSCSMWSLDLFVLLLPKLKGFISSLHHTSHVEMACGVIQVVLKKVAIVIRRTSKANKNKDKELKLIFCTNELKEIKEMANDVIQAVKRAKRSNTEDLASMKSVLQELHLALGTFFEQV
ncbi:uncharacterized protein [Acropora muricata]|uniref:uncharacterized protein isoform X3 n=1 Tax=Acropora muricata TaxID=159855 RepID=UPI0034E4ADDA